MKSKLVVSNNPSERGFSLIESAIAFLLIAIIVGMALPFVRSSLDAYNLRSAANHVAERLAAGRALAMEKNRSVSVVFLNTGQYGFDFDGDGAIDTRDPDQPSKGYYAEMLPSGVSFPSGLFPSGSTFISVTFNSRGELPIGTVIPAGAPGVGVALQGRSRRSFVWTNLRGRIWVQ